MASDIIERSLSTALTHARSESINADSLNSNFLQLGRRSGGRPQREVHPHALTCQHWYTVYFSRPRTHNLPTWVIIKFLSMAYTHFEFSKLISNLISWYLFAPDSLAYTWLLQTDRGASPVGGCSPFWGQRRLFGSSQWFVISRVRTIMWKPDSPIVDTIGQNNRPMR